MYGRQEYTHDRTPPSWAVAWLRRLFPDRRFAWNNRAGRWDMVKRFVRKGSCAVIWAKVGSIFDAQGRPAEITVEAMRGVEFQAYLQHDYHRTKLMPVRQQEAGEAEEDAAIASEQVDGLTDVFKRYHPVHLKRRGHANPRVSISMAGARR